MNNFFSKCRKKLLTFISCFEEDVYFAQNQACWKLGDLDILGWGSAAKMDNVYAK